MKLILFIPLLFCLCLFLPSRAYQSSPADSLIALLDSEIVERDTSRVQLLNKIAHQILRLNPEISQQYSLEAESISKEISYLEGLSRATYLLGSYHWLKGDHIISIQKCEEALRIAQSINNSFHKATALNGLALSYVQLNNTEQGLSYLHKAITEAEKIEDDFLLGSMLANTGWLHMQEGNYDMAEVHFLRLIELGKKNKDARMLIINNTALGTLSRKKGAYSKSLDYFKKALQISKKVGDIDLEGYSYIYYGEIYSEIGQEGKAEEYLLMAKRIFEELNSEKRLLNVYASLSDFYSKQERYQEASEVATKGLELSDKLKDSDYQPIFYESLTSAKSNLRDFEGAFLLQQEFMAWRDSLNAKKKNQKILELETIYQLEGIERENKLLKAEQDKQEAQLKLQSFIFIFILASLAFVGLTLLSLNRKNKKLNIANEQVLKSSKVKQEFLSTMSHEIRTPLNAVIGFTELLAIDEPRQDQKEYVNGLKTSSQHLLELINNVLDFSKIEAKKLELENIPFDLRKQLQSIINTYRISNTNERLSIELNTDLSLDQLIIGDPTRLYQILSNLLGNAIKFTSEGKVTLSVTTLQQNSKEISLQFGVNDTGIGIHKNKQKLIFGDFIQGSNATTRKFGGSGLGLSICQQLLELMGSHIELESEVGKGSQFRFNLLFPISQIEIETNSTNPIFVSEQQSLAGQRILLAEDNLLNQKIASTLLQKNGALVTIANNGQEAIELVQQQDFDLILMDLHMPVMDGFEAIEIIKNLPYPKNETHIVVLTATTDDIKLQYPIDFVQKPFDIEQLINVVKKNLESV